MRETRLGRPTPIDSNEFDVISVIKEKFDELEVDLLLKIKEHIHLEVQKVMKKQKEETKSAGAKLQEHVTKLEHAHYDLAQYVVAYVYVRKICQ